VPYRIFVVEDHPVMRDVYTRLLKREADMVLVGAAASAEEALAALDGTPCDLVIADVSLPGMDGIALVERLRARWPDLAALVISAYEEAVYARRARAASAHAFLSKQGLERTLPEAIREALGGTAPPR
jgi:DNA-binding NarL/FixJ family response regulator